MRGRVIQEAKTITGSGMYTTEWGYNPADMVDWMKYPEGSNGAMGASRWISRTTRSWCWNRPLHSHL